MRRFISYSLRAWIKTLQLLLFFARTVLEHTERANRVANRRNVQGRRNEEKRGGEKVAKWGHQGRSLSREEALRNNTVSFVDGSEVVKALLDREEIFILGQGMMGYDGCRNFQQTPSRAVKYAGIRPSWSNPTERCLPNQQPTTSAATNGISNAPAPETQAPQFRTVGSAVVKYRLVMLHQPVTVRVSTAESPERTPAQSSRTPRVVVHCIE